MLFCTSDLNVTIALGDHADQQLTSSNEVSTSLSLTVVQSTSSNTAEVTSSVLDNGGNTSSQASSTIAAGFNITSTGSPVISSDVATDNASSGLSTGGEVGIGIGAGLILLALVLLAAVYLLKKRATEKATQQSRDPNNIGGLQDHPEGSLPAEIAPRARHNRTPSLSFRSLGVRTESDFDAGAGASEVPINMRSPGTGSVKRDGTPVQIGPIELEGSSVRMAPVGVDHSRYHAYQVQAAHSRYSRVVNGSHPEAPYRGPAPTPVVHPSLQWRRDSDS
ncbi:unnamed protein product [Discula destructiva]